MNKPHHSCTKTCDKRELGCRSTCKEWIEYETEYAEWMAEREREIHEKEDVIAYQREAISKNVKRTHH